MTEASLWVTALLLSYGALTCHAVSSSGGSPSARVATEAPTSISISRRNSSILQQVPPTLLQSLLQQLGLGALAALPSPAAASAGRISRTRQQQHAASSGRPVKDDPPKGTDCYMIRERSECTLKQCVWCSNKWSPWPGSQGFCEWKEKVAELPALVYECKKVHKQQQQQQQQAPVAMAS